MRENTCDLSSSDRRNLLLPTVDPMKDTEKRLFNLEVAPVGSALLDQMKP